MKKLYYVSLLIIVLGIGFNTALAASEDKGNLGNLAIKEIVLPSEIKSLRKSPGAIYYNKSIKGKALIPVHFWGAVKNTGLHFVPVGTSFVDALSMAGGPNVYADTSKVSLYRRSAKGRKEYKFDLSEGADDPTYSFKVQPGDSVFVPRDFWRADRTFYSSLVNIGVSILTGILLYRQVQESGLKISF